MWGFIKQIFGSKPDKTDSASPAVAKPRPKTVSIGRNTRLWRQAVGRRDHSTALALADEILQSFPQEVETLRNAARLLSELGEVEKAVTYWKKLNDIKPDDFEAACQVARSVVQSGASVDEAVQNTSPQASAIMQKNMVGALRFEFKADQAERPLRHIAICGISYSGSTVIDRILGSSPDCVSVGESNWLMRRWLEEGQQLDFAINDEPEPSPCGICGYECEVFDFDFRRFLSFDRSKWFKKIARRLTTDVLVSADKNFVKLIQLDPMIDCDAMILYKSPQQAWASAIKRLKKDQSDDYYQAECTKFAKVWTDAYRNFLDNFNPTGQKLFVSFDDLSQRGDEGVAKLMSALNLSFDPGKLQQVIPGHAIGNNSVHKALLKEGFHVKINPLPPVDLPQEHIDILNNQADLLKTFSDLQELYKK